MPSSRAILHDLTKFKLKPHVKHVIDPVSSHLLHISIDDIKDVVLEPVELIQPIEAILEVPIEETQIATPDTIVTSIEVNAKDIVLEPVELTQPIEVIEQLSVEEIEIAAPKKRNPFKKKQVETT
jgi:hypothetical protein